MPIWLDNVDCQGYELSLLDCDINRIGSHDCQHSEDVEIGCTGYSDNLDPSDYIQVGDFRLVVNPLQEI